jgi:hypothetical protein
LVSLSQIPVFKFYRRCVEQEKPCATVPSTQKHICSCRLRATSILLVHNNGSTQSHTSSYTPHTGTSKLSGGSENFLKVPKKNQKKPRTREKSENRLIIIRRFHHKQGQNTRGFGPISAGRWIQSLMNKMESHGESHADAQLVCSHCNKVGATVCLAAARFITRPCEKVSGVPGHRAFMFMRSSGHGCGHGCNQHHR